MNLVDPPLGKNSNDLAAVYNAMGGFGVGLGHQNTLYNFLPDDNALNNGGVGGADEAGIAHFGGFESFYGAPAPTSTNADAI